jgi:uncharacterized protein (TIGR02466 family)
MIEEIRPFFTSIYCTTLDLDIVNIKQNIEQIKNETPTLVKSNSYGWQSPVYRESHKCIIDLVEQIKTILTPIYYNIGLDASPELACYWYNVNKRYSYNIAHTHAGCWFSAAYYVKAPSNSGKIVFERPDLLNSWIVTERLTDRNWATYMLPPKENLLVIFPSYLKHYVEQNLTEDKDDDRISIAFNFR